MRLWVDDERPAPEGWYHAYTSAHAIEMLILGQHHIEAISLDHDLGGDDTTRPIMLWMCENEVWPKEVRVHSMNPVGREWLAGMARRYAPETVTVTA
jgi:hypothetical protein